MNTFNEKAEYELLYRRDPMRAQARLLRPGFTREQAERFFARKRVNDAAQRRGDHGESGFGPGIDELIESGYTEMRTTNRWTFLDGPDGSVRFGTKAEREYIQLVLGVGSMKRNY